jgi:hypothetical protein
LAPAGANRAAGWIGIAGGGALLSASTVLLVVRESEIGKLNEACRGGVCPVARQNELESTRSRALVEGPVAIAVGVGGVVAASVGAYFVFKAEDGSPNPHARGTHIVPLVGWGAGGVAVAGAFR